jgi:hypothetical protein
MMVLYILSLAAGASAETMSLSEKHRIPTRQQDIFPSR